MDSSGSFTISSLHRRHHAGLSVRDAFDVTSAALSWLKSADLHRQHRAVFGGRSSVVLKITCRQLLPRDDQQDIAFVLRPFL